MNVKRLQRLTHRFNVVGETVALLVLSAWLAPQVVLAADENEDLLWKVLCMNITTEVSLEMGGFKLDWKNKFSITDCAINVPPAQVSYLMRNLREVANGQRTIARDYPLAERQRKLLRTPEIPPALIKRAATVSLIRLGDDLTIDNFVTAFLEREGDIKEKLEVLDEVAQPRLIPYLIPGIQKHEFNHVLQARILSGISYLCSQIVLRQVQHGHSFNDKARESARTLNESELAMEFVGDRIVRWYEHNEDLFAEEDFKKIGVVWVPGLK